MLIRCVYSYQKCAEDCKTTARQPRVHHVCLMDAPPDHPPPAVPCCADVPTCCRLVSPVPPTARGGGSCLLTASEVWGVWARNSRPNLTVWDCLRSEWPVESGHTVEWPERLRWTVGRWRELTLTRWWRSVDWLDWMERTVRCGEDGERALI